MDKTAYRVTAVLMIAGLALSAAPILGAIDRSRFTGTVERFHADLEDARRTALRTGGQVEIRLDNHGWRVREAGGRALASGRWTPDARLGMNLPGRFFFDGQGRCRIGAQALCGSEDEDLAHFVAITGAVRIIYTLYFDGSGRPLLDRAEF